MELWNKRVASKDSELPGPSHSQVFPGDRACSRGQNGLGTATTPAIQSSWRLNTSPGTQAWLMKDLIPKQSNDW